jgi:hypothetical protein
MTVSLDLIADLVGNGIGIFNTACPRCGPSKHSVSKRRKRTMRIWRLEPGFATYHCARCGEKGYAREYRCSASPDPVMIAKTKAEAIERKRQITKQRLRLARWLWQRRQPITGTIAELYLRARGYHGRLPGTLGFLPPSRNHSPALIAAFGMATEIDQLDHQQRWLAECGQLLPSPDDAAVPDVAPTPECSTLTTTDDAVVGVHLIKLRPDGSDRIRDDDLDPKVIIGRNFVAPIVLAAPNDLMALTIGEGIEKVLADHAVSGACAWASASAGRMPALADLVPSYIECVTVLVDNNNAGRDNADALAARLHARGLEVLLTPTREVRP